MPAMHVYTDSLTGIWNHQFNADPVVDGISGIIIYKGSKGIKLKKRSKSLHYFETGNMPLYTL